MQVKIDNGTPLYQTADVRRIESRNAQLPLMERAGHAAAQFARTLATDSGKSILIFAGSGNHGGDAFVVARYLKQWFFAVTVVFGGDAAKLPRDAAAAYAQWRAAGDLWDHALRHNAFPGYSNRPHLAFPPPWELARWEERAALEDLVSGGMQ